MINHMMASPQRFGPNVGGDNACAPSEQLMSLGAKESCAVTGKSTGRDGLADAVPAAA